MSRNSTRNNRKPNHRKSQINRNSRKQIRELQKRGKENEKML